MKKTVIFIAFVAIALALKIHADQPARFHEVARLSGADEAKKSAPFTVGPHWRITCTAANCGPDMDVKVYAETPTQSVQMIEMTSDGQKQASMRDSGTYRISTLGFSAEWTVVIEDQD